MKKFIILLGATLLMFAPLTGCQSANAKLETGGSYAKDGQAPDVAFYTVDAAFDFAYSTAETTFSLEKDNREFFKSLSPDIKKTMDSIRATAQDVALGYFKARKAYLDSPTPPGLSDLQTILLRIQGVAKAAQAAVPKLESAQVVNR